MVYNLKLKNKENSEYFYKSKIDSFVITHDRFFPYEKLKKDLIEISLSRMDSRQSICKESEDLINDRFRDALEDRGYIVCDQSRGGESQSAKSVGERDLVIKNRDNGITESIIESFELKGIDNTKINSHFYKLPNKYDTTGNEQNFILVYAKTESYQSLWNKYKKNFKNFKEEDTKKDNLKIGYTFNGKMKINHLFINFYSKPYVSEVQ